MMIEVWWCAECGPTRFVGEVREHRACPYCRKPTEIVRRGQFLMFPAINRAVECERARLDALLSAALSKLRAGDGKSADRDLFYVQRAGARLRLIARPDIASIDLDA